MIRFVERGCIVAGTVLLVVFAVAQTHRAVVSDADLRRFDEARESLQGPAAHGPVDTRLWSESRIAHYRASLGTDLGLPEAVLRVPRVEIEVAVHEGVDEVVLNRGVGRIPGTARIGEGGNLGIAGHRDGFFRGLKDVGPGDAIHLVSLHRTEVYVIDDIRIVDPSDVSVLAPTGSPVLTLVTCYPFYFVGSAPQRYIVRATLDRTLEDNP